MVLGFTEKSDFLGGGAVRRRVHEKPIEGGLPKKGGGGGLEQFTDLRGALARKRS